MTVIEQIEQEHKALEPLKEEKKRLLTDLKTVSKEIKRHQNKIIWLTEQLGK